MLGFLLEYSSDEGLVRVDQFDSCSAARRARSAYEDYSDNDVFVLAAESFEQLRE